MKAEDIWAMLEDVTDPEVPVLTVVDLGVVRDVIQLEKNHWKIVITPTYTGCPAMQVIEEDIKERLGKENLTSEVELVLSPAWTRSEERRVGKECRSRWSTYH